MLPADIIATTAKAFCTSIDEIMGPRYAKNIGQARAAAVFVLREHRVSSKISFERIAALVGSRDRKTIWYWWLKSQELRHNNACFRLLTDTLLAVAVCPPRPASFGQSTTLGESV